MKKIKGQVLNEAVVAMGIITVGILSITGFLSQGINEGRHISNQTTAINLAAEGIEIARNILDGNAVKDDEGIEAWNINFAAGLYELDYMSSALGASLANQDNLRRLRKRQVGNAMFYQYEEGTETIFRRSVEIRYIRNHQIRVTSRVFWEARGGRLNNVSLSSDFYYWRQ